MKGQPNKEHRSSEVPDTKFLEDEKRKSHPIVQINMPKDFNRDAYKDVQSRSKAAPRAEEAKDTKQIMKRPTKATSKPTEVEINDEPTICAFDKVPAVERVVPPAVSVPVRKDAVEGRTISK